MKIIKININKIDDYLVQEVVAVLRRGGIVVHPSDTCYGIAADIMNKKAVEKVCAFKNRNINKAFTMILEDKNKFEKYGEWHEMIDGFLKKRRLHTYVVNRVNDFPDHFNSRDNTIGIQIPRSILSLNILKLFGRPLTATSANISGMNNVYNIKTLISQIEKSGNNIYPDLILDAGQIKYNKPSKIIKIENGNYQIIRN